MQCNARKVACASLCTSNGKGLDHLLAGPQAGEWDCDALDVYRSGDHALANVLRDVVSKGVAQMC